MKIGGSEKIRLLHRASYLVNSMDRQFERICGPNKQYDPRYNTLSRMKSYIDSIITPDRRSNGFNYKLHDNEIETSSKLLGFIDNLETQFRSICGEKTDYVLDGETHGVDIRYQTLMELGDAVMESLGPGIIKMQPEYERAAARAEPLISEKVAA